MAKITDIKGVGDDFARELRDSGYNTVDAVAEADREELLEVNGVGEGNVGNLQESARSVIVGDHTQDEPVEPEDEQLEEGERPDFVDESSADAPNEGADREADAEDEEDEGTVAERARQNRSPEASEQRDRGETEEEPQRLSETAADESEDEDNGPYTFTLNVSDPKHFDYIVASLVRVETERRSSNPGQAEIADHILSELRGLDGTGDVELTMEGDEINTLHSALVQQENNYQGRVDGPFNAVRDLRSQVDEVRSEHLY